MYDRYGRMRKTHKKPLKVLTEASIDVENKKEETKAEVTKSEKPVTLPDPTPVTPETPVETSEDPDTNAVSPEPDETITETEEEED